MKYWGQYLDYVGTRIQEVITRSNIFFIGKFLTYRKIKLMEYMAQICQILKKKNFTSLYFYDKFQLVAKNIEGLCSFLLSCLVYSQIWLNYFLDDSHKILKRIPGPLIRGCKNLPLILIPSHPWLCTSLGHSKVVFIL